jgi:alpha-glucuronidase
MLASVGINGIVLNNVNTNKGRLKGWELLGPPHLAKVSALAGVFRRYGISVYLSVNFASPMLMGELATADPLDDNVQKWWREKAKEIYQEIPDFGGFLVKADSEGQPGPMNYGRTHSDGANMLAAALKPFGGMVIWRAFVYGKQFNPDRAVQAYDIFRPLDGSFSANVILQIKNGPLDFQVREAVSPLFGALPKTNTMLELQVTQEYTGQATHIVYLVPQWREILGFDTYAKGRGSTVAEVVGGRLFDRLDSGIAGVMNVGSDGNWTGLLLAQANTFGYGRLAWNPKLTADAITDEWVRMTFGSNPDVVSTISKMLLNSWKTYEDYTSPLGAGYFSARDHFNPDPEGRQSYHHADAHGVGYDRTVATGSKFTAQYQPAVRDRYESLATCPDELLLWFHHLPYTSRLRSGKTVIQHIYDSHFDGVETVKGWVHEWQRLRGHIDSERYEQVLRQLEAQRIDATRWRDAINLYFYRLSGISDVNGRINQSVGPY